MGTELAQPSPDQVGGFVWAEPADDDDEPDDAARGGRKGTAERKTEPITSCNWEPPGARARGCQALESLGGTTVNLGANCEV